MRSPLKTFTIVSGPNGSGKTTFIYDSYEALVREGYLLNADVIAHTMNPNDVSKVAISAGKKFLQTLDQRLQKGEPVLLETTLSGKSLLHKIDLAKSRGYRINFIFLWVSTPDLCDFRVKGRVASGGHNIPHQDIRRRYSRGLANLALYLEAADEYEIYQADQKPLLICRKNLKHPLDVQNQTLYEALKSQMTLSKT